MNHRRAGFRKIENDIFEALVTAGLSGAGYQVVLTIIDLTLGYRKGSEYRQWANIPLTRFEQATGLSRQSVRLGVRQAEGRYIIKAERNSTRPTKYALNPNIGEWVTRKQNHHSELDNGITPDWETKSPQTRKPVISRTIDIKETPKENIKERTTLPNELSGEVHHPTPAKEMSLTLRTPKGKAEANSLTNGPTVLPREDRATLESDLSALGSPSRGNPLGGHKVSYRERIAAYLGAHGPAPIKAIAQASRIKANAVNVTLHQGKGKLFCHFKAERTWGVNE